MYAEDKAEYIDAIRATEEQENMEVFREFIAKQQLKFLKAEIEKFEKLDKG